MKYIDRNGNITHENSTQDQFLKLLYTTKMGRLLLRPLVSPIVSKLGGLLMSTRLSTFFMRGFIRRNHINMDIYQHKRYVSYNDFFTRKIRPGYRPIDSRDNILISPCDGKISVYPINEDAALTIKNTTYTIPQLLRRENLAGQYNGGYALVIRLTVDDYHRYCYPASGRKSKQIHIPGIFHTVNPIANDVMPIYKMNSREYCLIRTKNMGTLLAMEVGALLVGKIRNHQPQSCLIQKGDEKGCFEFGGSTIVLLVQKNKVSIDEDLIKNTKNNYETFIKYGEAIGQSNTTI